MHMATRGFEGSGEHSQQRCLSRAIVTNEADTVSVFEGKTDIIERPYTRVATTCMLRDSSTHSAIY